MLAALALERLIDYGHDGTLWYHTGDKPCHDGVSQPIYKTGFCGFQRLQGAI